MKKKKKRSFILKKGIFVSVVDWVSQFRDSGQNESSMMSLDGTQAEMPEEEDAKRDGYLYFWKEDSSTNAAD